MDSSNTSITSPNRELHNHHLLMKSPLSHTNEYFNHLPPPPPASSAQLSLIKQLSLFLELEDLLMNGAPHQLNDQTDLDAESGSDISDYEDFLNKHIDSEDALEDDTNPGKISRKEKQRATTTSANSSLTGLSRGERFKPLIPSYFYEDNTCQYLSSKCEPMIGREWVFKEIEKVSRSCFG